MPSPISLPPNVVNSCLKHISGCKKLKLIPTWVSDKPLYPHLTLCVMFFEDSSRQTSPYLFWIRTLEKEMDNCFHRLLTEYTWRIHTHIPLHHTIPSRKSISHSHTNQKENFGVECLNHIALCPSKVWCLSLMICHVSLVENIFLYLSSSPCCLRPLNFSISTSTLFKIGILWFLLLLLIRDLQVVENSAPINVYKLQRKLNIMMEKQKNKRTTCLIKHL